MPRKSLNLIVVLLALPFESWVYPGRGLFAARTPCAVHVMKAQGPGGRQPLRGNFKAQISRPVNRLWNKKENEALALMKSVKVDEVRPREDDVSWVHHNSG